MKEGDDRSMRVKAEKIVQDKIAFYIHLVIYVAVNSMFIIMWATTDGLNSFPWFIFILIPWGIGLAAHYFATFMSSTYKEKMVRREIEKMKI